MTTGNPIQTGLATQHAAVRNQLAKAARKDLETFIQFVMRDEKTGKPLQLAPYHREMLRLAQTEDRLAFLTHVEAGKTVLFGMGYVLWRLGREPSLRIVVVSNAQSQAKKIVRTVGEYIANSAELHAVFPNLKPGGSVWRDDALIVARATLTRDFSLVAYGKHGAIVGSRVDLVLLDDADDFESTRTSEQRESLYAWVNSSVFSRLTEKAQVICSSNAWHPDDLCHRFARLPAWKAVRYAVLDDNGASRWPERWPLARIEQKRGLIGPAEFQRQMMAEARDEASAAIKSEWIKIALDRGAGRYLSHFGVGYGLPVGYRAFTGVDLAVQTSKSSKSDLSALVSVLQHPNGDLEVIGIEAGRFDALTIIAKVIESSKKYASTVVIENVAAQDYLRQIIEAHSSIPIVPFTTGRGQASLEYAIRQLAVRLGTGKIILPSGEDGTPDKEVAALAREMLDYHPSAHVGDRLAALCFALHGVGKAETRVQFGYLDLTSR